MPPASTPFVSQRRKEKSRQDTQPLEEDASMSTPKSSSFGYSDYGPSISSGPRRTKPKSMSSSRSSPRPLSTVLGGQHFSQSTLSTLSSRMNDIRKSPSKFGSAYRRSPAPDNLMVIEVSDSDHENHGSEDAVMNQGGDSTDTASEEEPNVFDSPVVTRQNSANSAAPSNMTSMSSLGSMDNLSKHKYPSINYARPQPQYPRAGTYPSGSRRKQVRRSATPVSPSDSPPSSPISDSPVRPPPRPPRAFETPTKQGRANFLDSSFPTASSSAPPATRSARTVEAPTKTKADGSRVPASQANPFLLPSVSTSGPSRVSKPTPAAQTPRSNTPQSQPRLAPSPPRPVPVTEPTPVPVPDRTTEAIEAFINLNLGALLGAHVIAHDRAVVEAFDRYQVPHIVQYLLARGETNNYWPWPAVLEKVEQFQGTVEDIGPRVAYIMGKGKVAPDNTILYVDALCYLESAREEDAMHEDLGRGLGIMGEWHGVANWYGGRIQQLARLIEKNGEFKIILEKLEMRRSHRFARFVGSRRILQLRIPKKLLENRPEDVRRFIAQKFVLLGRTFVPFHVKDGSVYMVETDEDYERVPQEWCGDQFRLSFVEFMEWHNPMALNSKQAISKFVTRYAIALSNTVPVIEFSRENMIFIDDIYSSDWPAGKPGAPAEKIMTDGCGFINVAALTIITRVMGYDSAPTALQGRIDGSKGLWVRHPTDESSEPKIWIRASQNKIKNPKLDRAHRIFELLGPSRASTNIALTTQAILNLNHNGVPDEKLVELFKTGLKDEVSGLLNWNSMPVLCDIVSKVGGVMGSRLARIAAESARAMGLRGAQWRPDDVESGDEADEELDEPTTYTGRNPYSGAPLGIHESVLELLQAGFHPRDTEILQSKLRQIIKTTVDTAVEKYRIPLLDSVAGWIIPDPFATPENPDGILDEGMIYFKSSQPLKDPKTEMAYHVITGPVVLGRYPMRLPSDLQKAIAIDLPEFALFTDVVIFSVRGSHSLASLLSGGDYDGDIVNIFRESSLVDAFVSKPLTEPPADLMEANFVNDVISVQSFCNLATTIEPKEVQSRYASILLADVLSPQKGLYSMFHDSAVATMGYDHRKTIRLAYIFNALLDASKTGLRLLDGIFEKDQKEHGSKPPPFGILARLRGEGEVILQEFYDLFDAVVLSGQNKQNLAKKWDPDLRKPYETTMAYIKELEDCEDIANKKLRYGRVTETDPEIKELMKQAAVGHALHDELRAIRHHVRTAREEFVRLAVKSKVEEQNASMFGTPSKKNKAKTKGGPGTRTDQSDDMYAAAKLYSSEIAQPIKVYALALEELKASCAYLEEFDATGKFPWSVAFAQLCLIKANARGIAPMIREIDECKTMSSSAVRALAKNDCGDIDL